jgi:hypothetical protein
MWRLLPLFIVSTCLANQKPDTAADGTPYPPVTFNEKSIPKFPAKTPSVQEKIESLLIHPLMDINRVFSATKSKGTLDHLNIRQRDVDSLSQWFTFGIANADLIYLQVDEGVITKVSLYYKRDAIPTWAHRIPTADENSKYKWDSNPDGGFWISCEIRTAYLFQLRHPDAPETTMRAIKAHEILKGMSMEEVNAAMDGGTFLGIEKDVNGLLCGKWVDDTGATVSVVFDDNRVVDFRR